MKLEHEIRKVLYACKRPVHPSVIRMRVLSERLGDGNKQSLKTFINVMGYMDDVEDVEINGKHYRQFKKAGLAKKLNDLITRVEKWVKLFLLNAVLWSCQLTQVIKGLAIRLKNLLK